MAIMNYIRDYILPLATIRFADCSDSFPTMSGIPHQFDAVGTCVLIGRRGFALTAAHVIDQLDLSAASAIFVHEGAWHHVRVIAHEKHSSEDVGIVQFAPSPLIERPSFYAVTGQMEYASRGVELWGYPRHVTEEPAREGHPNGAPQVRPDLIFFSGYIRRRIGRELPISLFRGKMFYELSIVAGEACSGSPLIVRRGALWDVAGVYVGEETSSPAYAVGYAAAADSFANWCPTIIGASIKCEAKTTAQE
jgi:hypothetical protein